MSYKLLIIDDESQRNETYKEIFKEGFEIVIQNDISSEFLLYAIDDHTIDGILLDMVLSKSNSPNKETFDHVMSLIGNKKPVILISRSFNTIASWINNQVEKSNVISFVGWDELCNDDDKLKNESAEIFVTRIKMALNGYFKRSNSVKDISESIKILHLSDLQFGDPDFAADASTLAEDWMADAIINQYNIEPDFLIVSGDIAYSGRPSEFDKGYEWISRFAKNVFPSSLSNIGERILLCPGNHDVNLSLHAADYYTYDFKKHQEGDAQNNFLKTRQPSIDDHGQFGLLPFCRFAYRLTGDLNWIDNPYGNSFVNDRFLNWGVRFVHLNTVMELNYLNPNKISLMADKISLLGQNTPKVSKNVFTVYIGHNDPDDMGFKPSTEPLGSVAALFGLINSIGGKLYVHGHKHQSERLKNLSYEGKNTVNIKYCQAGSLTLNKRVRPSDSRRSFSLIECFRENGVIKKYTQKIFEIEGQIIDEIPRKESSVDL